MCCRQHAADCESWSHMSYDAWFNILFWPILFHHGTHSVSSIFWSKNTVTLQKSKSKKNICFNEWFNNMQPSFIPRVWFVFIIRKKIIFTTTCTLIFSLSLKALEKILQNYLYDCMFRYILKLLRSYVLCVCVYR